MHRTHFWVLFEYIFQQYKYGNLGRFSVQLEYITNWYFSIKSFLNRVHFEYVREMYSIHEGFYRNVLAWHLTYVLEMYSIHEGFYLNVLVWHFAYVLKMYSIHEGFFRNVLAWHLAYVREMYSILIGMCRNVRGLYSKCTDKCIHIVLQNVPNYQICTKISTRYYTEKYAKISTRVLLFGVKINRAYA